MNEQLLETLTNRVYLYCNDYNSLREALREAYELGRRHEAYLS